MDIILYKILTVVIMLCLHNTATALPDLQKALQNLGKNFQSVQTEDTKVRSPQCDTKPTVTEMQLNTFSRASPATNALNSLALSQSLTSQQMGVTSDSLATDADADEEPASPDDSDSTSTTDDSSDGGGGFHPFGRKRRGLLDSLTDTISSIPLFGGSSSSSADDSSSSSDDDSGDDQTRNEKNFESSILQVPNVISQLLPSILKPVGEAVSGVVSSAASILDGVVGGSGESRDGESSCFWASLKCSQNAKYRTMDGSCNNLKHPSWGAANSIHRRFVPNRYHDLISTPRELSAKGGAKLRNVREISTILSQSLGAPSSSASLLLPALGQFLDHDITKTPQPNLTCCAKSQECLSSECFAIQVPPNDAFFTPLGVKCLNFIRSIPGVREDCSLGPREQMNQLSHFIDASQVYGSSRNESENLRNKIKGQLRFRNGQTGTQNDQTTDIRNQFPPTDANCPAGKGGAPANANAINTKVQTCILAGDTRANVQPGLQFMHVLFLRLHNSVAAFIAKNKPKLSDEKIFQEARKIVIGTWQTIVLGEYLPMVLGQPASTDLTQLWSSQYIYNPRLRVGTRNEFTTAAYRFGHAAIRKQVPKNDVSTGKNAGFSDLSENYFSPFQIYGKGLDEIGNGYRQEPAKLVSRQMTDQLQNMLFKPPGQKYGTDLFALNLQRGRDHGIGTYNDLRRFCGLAPASSMSDLSATHAPDSVKALDKAYNGNVEDIDLFAGGVSENFADGSLVGPTFACVIRKQFEILRNGDRYWHESDKEFTSDQQQELHKTKLARLICDFTNNLSVQRDVLQLVTSNNPSIKCSSVADLPVVDYSVFLSSVYTSGVVCIDNNEPNPVTYWLRSSVRANERI